jgi:serine/threonine-protein kinase
MALAAGTTLGSYEITGAIGAGGMGEVYRARDSKLGREVAVKVLPEAFLADAERILRFEREARLLASLNHPHIAALYGMERSDGRHFLVMELVEGETLADRLLQGAMPAGEALEIARQIAEALEAAHERGVVHRDLKPANVKVTPDDRVKVLDFGLAKAMESEPAGASLANSPTLSMMATEAGRILGTAAYMSPEQAKGLPVDHRSDVFSFGAVLYEMLTGRRAFRGDTPAEVLASVLVRDPDLTALPPTLDSRVSELLRRCLERERKRRWQAIGDVRAEIETILASPAPALYNLRASPRRPLWRRAAPAVAAALLAAAVTGLVVWKLRPQGGVPQVVRFRFVPPGGHQFYSAARQMLAMSRDGTQFAYVSDGRVFIHRMDRTDVQTVEGIDAVIGATNLAYSPDGQSLAFWSIDRTLKRVATAGGTAVTLCEEAENPYGVSWDESGILYGQPNGIMRVSAQGGKPELLARVEPGQVAYGPQMLPGGAAVLFTIANGFSPDQWDKAVVVVQSLKTSTRKTLLEGGGDARYIPTGHLVYAVGGTLFARRFDPNRVEVSGEAVPVLEGVKRATAGATGAAHFAFSSTGSIVYIPGPPGLSSTQLVLALVDAKGNIEQLKLPSASYDHPRVSPDGRRIAFGTTDLREANVWIYDLAGTGGMRRLTFSGANRFPLWSADSQRVIFQSDREHDTAIWWQRSDGTGTPERLTRADPGTSHIPESWSPDGKHLLFTVNEGAEFSLRVLTVRDGTIEPFDAVRSSARITAAFSPDGKWVAYSAAPQGTATQIYVQPYPATGAKYELFAEPGDNPHHPLWTRDGKGLLYVPHVGGFERVPVVSEPTFAFGDPVAAPRAFTSAAPTTQRPFDVTADGRILCIVPAGTQSLSSLVAEPMEVVLNWFTELNQRVPPAR